MPFIVLMTKSDLAYLMLNVSVSSLLDATPSILQGLRDLEGRWEKGSESEKGQFNSSYKKISVWARWFVCSLLDDCAAFCQRFCTHVCCLLSNGHVDKLMRLVHSFLFRQVLPAAMSAWILGFQEACERHSLCNLLHAPTTKSSYWRFSGWEKATTLFWGNERSLLTFVIEQRRWCVRKCGIAVSLKVS